MTADTSPALPRWDAATEAPRLVRPTTRWRELSLVWDEAPEAVFLCALRDRLFLLDRWDHDRLAPSPATSLARYEVPELLDRVEVQHALRAPARVVDRGAALAEVLRTFEANEWRPLLVSGYDDLRVVRPASVLRWLAVAKPYLEGREAIRK